MMYDEKLCILQYEEKILKGKKKATAGIYVGSEDVRSRQALAVFRYAIEHILQWTPDEALANFTFEVLRNLNLLNEWTNLKLPREVRQYKMTKYVVAMLYPQYMQLFALETLTVQVYRSSLEQRHGVFPKGYFMDLDGTKKAIICLRFMLNNYTIFPNVEQMYKEFADTEMIMRLLKSYGLSDPAELLFDSPLEYLHESLPRKQRDDLLYNYYRFLKEMRDYGTKPEGEMNEDTGDT